MIIETDAIHNAPYLGAFFAKWGYGAFDGDDFTRQFAHESYGVIAAKDRTPEVPLIAGPLTEGPAIIGALLYRFAGDDCEIIEIAVNAACRRRGIAQKMMTELQNLSAQKNITRLILEVAEDNAPAIAFYKSYGFQPVGRRNAYYRQKIDAIIMECHGMDLWLSKA